MSAMRDVRQDRRDTIWVAGLSAFVGSLILERFLPLSGAGLHRLVLLFFGAWGLLYAILRPWASRVADWSGGSVGDDLPPPFP
ncbi:MAG: hypothetical protein ABI910_00840 [Gemmatimonadota bacterium]